MRSLLAALLLSACLTTSAWAYEGPVAKRPFAVAAFPFEDGSRLPVTVGYETYGTLNARRDNAILICHFFGGTSHAAGRYAPGEAPGYWDALIGKGRALDTERYFVVSVDVLANINAGDPHVITTGPATRDSATGRPYGARFPKVTIRDQVALQRRLMEALGIARWHAVMGASLGGMQALEWAVSYPERVARAIAIAAPGRSDAYNQAKSQIMIEAIQADGRYRGGDYYGHEPPKAGLAAAWKLLYAQILNRDALSARHPGVPEAGEPPFVKELADKAAQRIPGLDANAWVALARASRDHDLGRGRGGYEAALSRVQARLMIMPAEGDMLFPPAAVEKDLARPLERAGKEVAFRVLSTRLGHLGAIYELEKEAEAIRAFLAR